MHSYCVSEFHGLWLGATLTRHSQKFLWTHIRKEIADDIELLVQEQSPVIHRVKRIAEDFRDEVLDKSEIEEELKDMYDSYEDNKSIIPEEEAQDNDNDELESWEIPTKRTFPNDYDYFDVKQSNNVKRFSRNFRNLKIKREKATTLFNLKDSSEENQDEDYYDKQEQSGLAATTVMDDSTLSLTTISVTDTSQTEEESSVRTEELFVTNFKTDNLTTASSAFYTETSAPDDTTTEQLDLDTTTVVINESEKTEAPTESTTKIIVSTSESTTELSTDLTENETQDDTEPQTTHAGNSTEAHLTTTNAPEKYTTQLIEEVTEKLTDKLLENLIHCLKMNEQGKLIAMNCSLKQSFVCEIRMYTVLIFIIINAVKNIIFLGSNKTKTNKVEGFTKDGIDYIVTNEKLQWKKAFRKCNRTFGGYLAIFNNIDEINFINNISKGNNIKITKTDLISKVNCALVAFGFR